LIIAIEHQQCANTNRGLHAFSRNPHYSVGAFHILHNSLSPHNNNKAAGSMGAWPRIKLIKAKHPTITLTKHRQTALAYYFISLAVKAHIFPDAKAAGVLDLYGTIRK